MTLTNEILIRLPKIKLGEKFVERINFEALDFFLSQNLSPFFENEPYDLITTKEGFQIIKLNTNEEFYLSIEENQIILFHSLTKETLSIIKKNKTQIERTEIKQEQEDQVQTIQTVKWNKDTAEYTYETKKNGQTILQGNLIPLNMTHNSVEYFIYNNFKKPIAKNWFQKIISPTPIVTVHYQYGKNHYQSIFEQLEKTLKKDSQNLSRSRKEVP